MTFDLELFKEDLTDFRLSQKKSISQAAVDADVAESTFYCLYHRGISKIDILAKLCTYMGVSPAKYFN
ncbi:hypothetical protein UFOVP1483_13 [uncultured Caudovirales phage]|uniref:Uncharacterized protein n=1 Tax=uncultured Caudovirales phage TaxID=2100421 RepID=A0A6J5SN95_9CAUD|nr:hypothetical protein UFOVP1483_13 [uncultured Caudovirales phage]